MPTPRDPDAREPAGTGDPSSSVPPDTSACSPSVRPLPASSPPQLFELTQDISRELLQLILTTPTVEAYLDELVLLVQRVSPVVAGCGITMRQVAGVLTVSASNALAGALDEVQYQLEQGPCLQALRNGEVVAVDDVATEQRFGGWPNHALDNGVLSSLSVPMQVAGVNMGALNCYSRESHAFGSAVRGELIALAAQAEVMLALTLRAAQQSSIVDQLHTAMQTRSTIDQALGIMMVRQRCTATEAFVLLRAASQSSNRKVVDIAVDLITTTTGSPPVDGRFEV